MARGPKKRRDFLKRKPDKPKHNWSNEGSNRRRMLDMRRERYFRFDLKGVLEGTSNQENKNIIAATLTNKAAKVGIGEAIEYIDRLDDKSLEPDIRDNVKRLLERYSTFR